MEPRPKLETTTARNTCCRADASIPWDRSTRMAYIDRAHEPTTSSTCAVTDSLSVSVTPSTLKPRLDDTTCCQTGCQTRLTTGCIVYTNIQPVVKPFNNRLNVCIHNLNPFDNRFDNRLNRVNGV